MQIIFDFIRTTKRAFAFGKEYINAKLVRKVLRSLPDRFNIKSTTIEEAKDIDIMLINELIGFSRPLRSILMKLR
uniref:UBN2 domain-containing protein n=1 Tax=Gossypium raimondii TaxID=29730 RepID=A0A0D2T192_GOSRA|nr:hypothetical protein B456_008G060900 [Gossypium raimondii]